MPQSALDDPIAMPVISSCLKWQRNKLYYDSALAQRHMPPEPPELQWPSNLLTGDGWVTLAVYAVMAAVTGGLEASCPAGRLALGFKLPVAPEYLFL